MFNDERFVLFHHLPREEKYEAVLGINLKKKLPFIFKIIQIDSLWLSFFSIKRSMKMSQDMLGKEIEVSHVKCN